MNPGTENTGILSEKAMAALPPLVAAAAAQIHEHYGEVYGVAELAAQLEVSRGYLIRCFAGAVGMQPGKYLTLVRVENAKRLLAAEGHNLEVTAILCGFSGANYLCKVFKRHTGASPAAWRRKHKAAASGAGPAAGWDEPEDAQLSVDDWDEQVWV